MHLLGQPRRLNGTRSGAASNMDVCGIDPGLETTGYAVIRAAGDSPSVLDAGVFTTRPADLLPQRLVQLADDFEEVLRQWRPALVGVEQLYAHYKHPRTAVQMAHARGVLLSAAHRSGAAVRSFSATHIKKYLTGNGRASKTQMRQAVQALFNLPVPPESADVADAIAVAFCCAAQPATSTLETAP